MTRTTSMSQRSSLYVTIWTGWVAWCLFVLVTVFVTSAALFERHTAICGGEGSTLRNWDFDLLPFAQACVEMGAPSAPAVAGVVQTVFVYFSLLVSLAATAYLLSRGHVRDLPRAALSLFCAQGVGAVFVAAAIAVQQIADDTSPPLIGVDLGLVWSMAVALGFGVVIVLFGFIGVTLVGLGRARADTTLSQPSADDLTEKRPDTT